MTRREVKNVYFEWIYSTVCDQKRHSYRKLLRYLYSMQFQVVMDMDENRSYDGEDLRYRFGREYYGENNPNRNAIVASYLDDEPCSVLEMMAALAIRCEEHIMSNDKFGDRTSLWFMLMLENLGLMGMYDSRFDEQYVDDIIYNFMYRHYDREGHGNIFTIEGYEGDLRCMEIWYQMHAFLSAYFEE